MRYEREPSGKKVDCLTPPKRGALPPGAKPPCKNLGIGGHYYKRVDSVAEKGFDQIVAEERLRR